jgi:hypothetical protein
MKKIIRKIELMGGRLVNIKGLGSSQHFSD